MENATLLYDGTFEGILCSVFVAFEEKLDVQDIQLQDEAAPALFGETLEIFTDPEKANRVWKAIQKKSNQNTRLQLKWSLLSELPGIEMHVFRVMKRILTSSEKVDGDYADPSFLKISQVAKMVGREKHRMEAFVRFRLTKDQIYFAAIEPDFNVLPLIKKHFTNRYGDQNWIIYDLRRNFGLYYNCSKTEYVTLDLEDNIGIMGAPEAFFDCSEIEFQKLWKAYFDSTNIKKRVNMRLHLQHVPKRYWKYLTEKSSFA